MCAVYMRLHSVHGNHACFSGNAETVVLRLSPLSTGVRVVSSLCTGFTRLRGERGLYLIPIILVNVSSGKNSSDPLFLFQRPVELDLTFFV